MSKVEQSVRLNLALTGDGWLEGALFVGEATHPLSASYVEDSPAQLLDATRAACLGGQGDVAWLREPEADVWRLASNDRSICLGLDRVTAWPRVGWSPGREAITYGISRVHWMRAVLRAMSTLGGDLDLYLSAWHRPFPDTSVEAVRALLAEERGR